MHRCKCVLLGPTGVGKTCLATTFVSGRFTELHKTTIGASFLEKKIDTGEKETMFMIWDTAGQERYSALTPFYYRDASACIIVYDITRADSFSAACGWVRRIRDEVVAGPLVVLVGNKLDLDTERAVQLDVASAYAAHEGVGFFETSALTGENVHQLFLWIAEEVEPEYQDAEEVPADLAPAAAPPDATCC